MQLCSDCKTRQTRQASQAEPGSASDDIESVMEDGGYVVLGTRDTRCCLCVLVEDDLVILRFKEGAHQELADAEEIMEAIAALLVAPRPIVVLVDARGGGVATREAREHYAQAARQRTVAQAIVIGNTFTRVAVTLFLRLTAPHVPTKVFTSEPEAVAWLRETMAYARSV